MTVTPSNLTPRQGKCLRYVIDRRAFGVKSPQLVTKIEWSDLPHNLLQARATLEQLCAFKLAERNADGSYVPTKAGQELIKCANKDGLWNA